MRYFGAFRPFVQETQFSGLLVNQITSDTHYLPYFSFPMLFQKKAATVATEHEPNRVVNGSSSIGLTQQRANPAEVADPINQNS